MLNLMSLEENYEDDSMLEKYVDTEWEQLSAEHVNGLTECCNPNLDSSTLQELSDSPSVSNRLPGEDSNAEKDSKNNTNCDLTSETGEEVPDGELGSAIHTDCDVSVDKTKETEQTERHPPDAVLPIMQHCQPERSKCLTR